LKPINSAIEHYLVKKIVKRKKREMEFEDEENPTSSELFLVK